MSEAPTLRSSLSYRWRLPITIVALFAGWLGALFSQPWIAENSDADRWFDAAGWLLLASGIALRAWASREIGGRKRRTVVDTGPYALCRNPLYLGTLLLAVSQLFFLRSLCYLAALLVPVFVYMFGVVPAEERYLTEVLGTDYVNYCQHTPRWWPRWNTRAWQSRGVDGGTSFDRETLSLVAWLALPFLSELTCYLRELPGWPHWPLPY